MKNKLILKGLFITLAFSLIMPVNLATAANEVWTVEDPMLDVSTEITAADIGESEEALNNATSEATTSVTKTGTLIEIGNTTADNTTIIIRTEDGEGNIEDQTVEVEPTTGIYDSSWGSSDLSDWIAGDQITYTATDFNNSGAIVAGSLRNRAHHWYHTGKNGWVTAIRVTENEMDITWNGQTYTLNTEDAHMVSGVNNPATLDQFKIGDRIRARVSDDGDGNSSTWDASIVVVLRRGSVLFMRVTRWVVGGEIYNLPEDLSKPFTMDVKILDTPFFEANDVNNLIGEPGDIIKVDVTEGTYLARKYFGKAFLKEFSEGDSIRIIGRRDEDTGHVVAKFIKNNDIQRIGYIYRLGKVNSVDTNGNTIDITLIRTRRAIKDWTIEVLASTKIYKAHELVDISDIQANDKIRVIGGSMNIDNRTVMALRINVLSESMTPEIVTPVE